MMLILVFHQNVHLEYPNTIHQKMKNFICCPNEKKTLKEEKFSHNMIEKKEKFTDPPEDCFWIN